MTNSTIPDGQVTETIYRLIRQREYAEVIRVIVFFFVQKCSNDWDWLSGADASLSALPVCCRPLLLQLSVCCRRWIDDFCGSNVFCVAFVFAVGVLSKVSSGALSPGLLLLSNPGLSKRHRLVLITTHSVPPVLMWFCVFVVVFVLVATVTVSSRQFVRKATSTNCISLSLSSRYLACIWCSVSWLIMAVMVMDWLLLLCWLA